MPSVRDLFGLFNDDGTLSALLAGDQQSPASIQPLHERIKDMQRRPPRAVALASSYSDWSGLAGQFASTFSLVANARGTLPAIKVVATNGSNAVPKFTRNLGRDIEPRGKLGVWLYLPPENFPGDGYAGTQIGPMKIRVSPDDVASAPTNYRVITLLTTTLAPGWQRYTVDLQGTAASELQGAWTNVGTATASSLIRYVEVELSIGSTVTGNRMAMLQSIDIGEYERPSLTLCFDGYYFAGGTYPNHKAVLTALRDAGLPAALCIRTGDAAGVDALTQTIINDGNAFYAKGWQIVQMTGRDINYSTGANSALFADQWAIGRDRIKRLGWAEGADTCFAYPNNASTKVCNDFLVAQGVKWIRGHQKVTNKQGLYGWDGPFAGNLTSAQLTYATGFQPYLRHAVDHGENMCVFAHELVSGAASDSLKTNITEFQTFLNGAIELRDLGMLDWYTPSQFVKAMEVVKRVS